jgi:hypothetical protein
LLTVLAVTNEATELSPLSDVRTSSPWLAFTGLIPVIVMVPILLLHWYAAGVLVAAAGCVAVVTYHLARRQGVTSLDALALIFAATNVVLYFGLSNEWLIKHVAVVFYTLLAAQCAVSLVQGEPWTTQFTRRTVTPEFAADPRFRAMNVRTTAVWAAAFAACDAISLAAADPVSTWAPVCVMVAAVAVSRVGGRRFLLQAVGTA